MSQPITHAATPDDHILHLQHLVTMGTPLTLDQQHDLQSFQNGTYGQSTSTGTGTTTPTNTAAPGNDLTYTQIIEQTLASWGLSDLNSLVESLGRTGASQDQITLAIQQSPEYATRFAGNAQRVANGLAALDPASYIALEGQYRQVLAGLPAGFYDDKASFDNFIGNDISPSELSNRVAVANQVYLTADAGTRAAWDQYYGNTSGVGGAIASILDSKTAEPIIEQRALAAEIGGAALSQGLGLTSMANAQQAASQGVTIESARQAYQTIAAQHAANQANAARFGTQFGQTEEEQAQLLGQGSALTQQQLLSSQEASLFGGHSGADQHSTNQGANF